MGSMEQLRAVWGAEELRSQLNLPDPIAREAHKCPRCLDSGRWGDECTTCKGSGFLLVKPPGSMLAFKPEHLTLNEVRGSLDLPPIVHRSGVSISEHRKIWGPQAWHTQPPKPSKLNHPDIDPATWKPLSYDEYRAKTPGTLVTHKPSRLWVTLLKGVIWSSLQYLRWSTGNPDLCLEDVRSP